MRPSAVIITSIALLCTAGQAAALGIDFGVAAGLQLQGDVSELELDTDSGFSLGLELMFEVPIVKLGVGYEYGFPRGTDGTLTDIEYHLLYGIARLHFLGPAYIMGRAGYANMRAELDKLQGSDTGLSWSLGLGVKVRRFRIEVDYNEFDISVDDFGGTIDYSNYAARLVISF